jgi:hypothetical protein
MSPVNSGQNPLTRKAEEQLEHGSGDHDMSNGSAPTCGVWESFEGNNSTKSGQSAKVSGGYMCSDGTSGSYEFSADNGQECVKAKSTDASGKTTSESSCTGSGESSGTSGSEGSNGSEGAGGADGGGDAAPATTDPETRPMDEGGQRSTEIMTPEEILARDESPEDAISKPAGDQPGADEMRLNVDWETAKKQGMGQDINWGQDGGDGTGLKTSVETPEVNEAGFAPGFLGPDPIDENREPPRQDVPKIG